MQILDQRDAGPVLTAGKQAAAEHAETASEEATEASLRDSLTRTCVDVAVILGSADIRVAKLVGVRPGDVIVLSTRIGNPLEVRVNDKVKFRGYPGISNAKLAVKLILEE